MTAMHRSELYDLSQAHLVFMEANERLSIIPKNEKIKDVGISQKMASFQPKDEGHG